MSKTLESINAQGGIDNHAKIAGIDSKLRATEQAEVLGEKLKETGAKEGLDSSTQKIADAIDKIAHTSATKAAGQLRSDIKSIKEAGSPEEYKALQAALAEGKVAKEKSSVDTLGKDGYINAMSKEGVTSASNMGITYDNTKKYLEAEGKDSSHKSIIEELRRENSKIDNIKRFPARAANAAESGGNWLLDKAENFTGWDINGDGNIGSDNPSGSLWSEGFGIAGAGVLTQEAYSRLRGQGGGALTKAGKWMWGGAEKAYNKLTGKSSGSIFDESPNKPTQGSDNKHNPKDHYETGNDGVDNKREFHNNTSRTTDFAGAPNKNHPVNRPKGILSNISEFFNSRIDAVTDALDGKGNKTTKLGLAASAMILGYQSETFANALQLADPRSFWTGTSMSRDADLRFNSPVAQNLSGVTPMPSAPIGQALTQQITQNAGTNMDAIRASNGGTAIVRTMGGEMPITTNSGKLTLGTTGRII